MFTGIVEEIGTMQSVQKGSNSAKLTIKASKVLTDTKLGDSINTNGVCLTVTRMDQHTFTVDVMHETLRSSNLGSLHNGSKVNLERAMQARDRFGGHIVSGHIDGIGTIKNITQDDIAYRVRIQTTPKIMRYIIAKGSIAIDGISLTVASLDDTSFSVSIIPHTKDETTLLSKKSGDTVNLENDIIGKYTEKLMQPYKDEKTSQIDEAFLKRHGY